MRRFSQRNSLVTLNEINITPLLDLAFVLLIIFVITRPMLEQSMNMKLPEAGKQNNQNRVDQNDIKTVEINSLGQFRLNSRTMTLPQIEKELISFKSNPKLVVYIRADKSASWDNVAKVLSVCLNNGITRVSPQTAPEK